MLFFNRINSEKEYGGGGMNQDFKEAFQTFIEKRIETVYLDYDLTHASQSFQKNLQQGFDRINETDSYSQEAFSALWDEHSDLFFRQLDDIFKTIYKAGMSDCVSLFVDLQNNKRGE